METSVVIKEQKTEDTYAYTYETPTEWTPYNSNLQMHGIKVLVLYLFFIFKNKSPGLCQRSRPWPLPLSLWQRVLHPGHGEGGEAEADQGKGKGRENHKRDNKGDMAVNKDWPLMFQSPEYVMKQILLTCVWVRLGKYWLYIVLLIGILPTLWNGPEPSQIKLPSHQTRGLFSVSKLIFFSRFFSSFLTKLF